LKALIKGMVKERGEVNIHGAKNSILPLVCSSILFNKSSFENVPDIVDLQYLLKILEADLSITSSKYDGILRIDCSKNVSKAAVLSHKHIGSIRYSTLLMGALLGSGVDNVSIPISGGCSSFGDRPIDIHLSGFESLGYSVETTNTFIKIERTNLVDKSVNLNLRFASVGATINLVMAALGRSGDTVISNIAKEPEVSNLIAYLSERTNRISLGNDFVKVYGLSEENIKEDLNEVSWPVMPDRIEAVSYIILGALASGCEINNISGLDLTGVENVLKAMGINYNFNKEKLIVNPSKHSLSTIQIKTGIFPNLNTDYQPLVTMALLFANGESTIIDEIYPKRFAYLTELEDHISADILKFDAGKVIIKGSDKLTFSGNELYAHDLRAGFCMCLISGLFEQDVVIDNFDQVKRGYSNLVKNFETFGIEIQEL
jgi:UDP-N-acetylglucosamine 1-carboxyvinyltransferase